MIVTIGIWETMLSLLNKNMISISTKRENGAITALVNLGNRKYKAVVRITGEMGSDLRYFTKMSAEECFRDLLTSQIKQNDFSSLQEIKES